MQTIVESITIKTTEPLGFIEITDKIAEIVKKSPINNGLTVLTTQHTTAALCVNEKCGRLQEDMKGLLKNIAPPNAKYRHNHSTIDGRSNAHSHLMSLILKTTEIVPIVKGQLQLGTWQSIFFVELDGPRSERNINVMVIGK